MSLYLNYTFYRASGTAISFPESVSVKTVLEGHILVDPAFLTEDLCQVVALQSTPEGFLRQAKVHHGTSGAFWEILPFPQQCHSTI